MKQRLDLVEVAPQSDPPVCRIMDYGKYRYEQTKKVKEAKKKQHAFKVKELKMRPNTDQHDYDTKLRHGQDFLQKGCKLKVTIVFHGREMAHRELGFSDFRTISTGYRAVWFCGNAAKRCWSYNCYRYWSDKI